MENEQKQKFQRLKQSKEFLYRLVYDWNGLTLPNMAEAFSGIKM